MPPTPPPPLTASSDLPPNSSTTPQKDQQDPSTPPCTTLANIRARASHFATLRDWNQFHNPRNLLLALVGEVGELSECFQWHPDAECADNLKGFSVEEKVHVGEEMADVLIYLVRLSEACGVDLEKVTERKFGINDRKYPVGVARGSRRKYNRLRREGEDGGDVGGDKEQVEN